MIKNIIQLTVLGVVWKRYKSVIISTLLLFVYFWLIGMLHDDYLSYTELNQDPAHLGLSYIVKWLAFFIGVMVYLWFHIFFPRLKKPRSTPTIQKEASKPLNPTETDPFAEIRQRKKLRSRADFIIDKQKD